MVTQPVSGTARDKPQWPGSVPCAFGCYTLLSLGCRKDLEVYENKAKTRRKHIEAEDIETKNT